ASTLGTAWLICDRPEYFSAQARQLILERLADPTSTEKYLAISRWPLPAEWHALDNAALCIVAGPEENLGPLVPDLMAALPTELAAIIEPRALALVDQAGSADHCGAEAILDWLPAEAGLYLHARQLADGSLERDNFLAYLGKAGLQPAGAELIERLLCQAAILDPLDAMAILEPFSLPSGIGRKLAAGASQLDSLYTAFLIDLFNRGKIAATLPLLHRTGDGVDAIRFVYDAIMNSAQQPDSPAAPDTRSLSAANRELCNFYVAAREVDRKRQSAALVRANDLLDGKHSRCRFALMQAEFAYAEGNIEAMAKRTREALLLLDRSTPPKLGSRIQRMMGLAALSVEKYADAGDYLTNAAEIAEAGGDRHELCQTLYLRALVEFMSGSLVRATKLAAEARALARRLCRPDLMVDLGLMAARLDMELGLYDEAARHFAALAEFAAANQQADAGQRAAVWQARCLGYAGQTAAASDLLELHADDAEARLFRAELEILLHQPAQAAARLREPPEIQPRPFLPPDSRDRRSLFQEMEGRAICFDQANSLINDMHLALRLLASGLAEVDASKAVELAALTREARFKNNPAYATVCMYCYVLEDELQAEPVDKQTILSRAFNYLQQRAGKIEERASRAIFMEKNLWNHRLLEAAREHKFL
ncbi:MAG TPA: hypothetical protein DIV58_10715, partial [Spirochaetaceae bacterium]|nr:hypothetical protein [Spirochaetaceae bacterium]